MKEETKQILPNMTIGDVVQKFPQTAPVLLGYGLQCVGCAVNPYETIEQGSLGHGMDQEMIECLLDELNLVVTKKPEYALNEAGVTLSPRAIETLEVMIAEEKEEGSKEVGLRVIAKKLEQGIDYELDLADGPKEHDQIIEQDGLKLYMDNASLEIMKPSVIDYQRQLQGEGFKIISLKEEEERCACDKPISECGCQNGEGCACGSPGSCC